MKPTDWIIVPGWDRFQHYKDRNPPWIKVYARLQADPNWLGLTQSAQGLLLNIWLAYSSTNGRVTVEKLRRITSEPWQTRNLETLNRAGFIAFSASEPLAARKHLDRDRDIKNSKPAKTPKPQPRKTKVTGWRIVRGTHGMTTIPDPNGTDPAPTIGRPL